MKLVAGFRRRGYSFPGTDDKLCARVWSMHSCSRLTILQFRAWFHTEVVVSKANLCVLLSHSRWVSNMLDRMYDEAEWEGDDKLEIVRKVINTLRHYLEEDPISSADVQRTLRQVIEKSGKMNYFISGRGKILDEDFEALVKELLASLYYDHFSESLYDATPRGEDAPVLKKQKIAKMKQFPGSSACCLPHTESGMDRWRNVSETLPINADSLKSKSSSGKALPLGDDNRALVRSMKFPVGSKFPVGAVAA